MSEPIQGPKGTRDFYPEDMGVQNHIFDCWRKVCRAFGYEEYEGPTFENLELYTGKSGAEIVGQLYHFKDKGDRDLALRPELTPTLARMVNQKGSGLRKPLKWFSIPRLYRYERMQRGRLREFFQLNMDIVGCDTWAAEIDLISAVIEMMKEFGLGEKDFSIRISSRQVLSEFLEGLGVPEDKRASVYSALDKRAKIGEAEFCRLLEKEGLIKRNIDAVETFFNCKTWEDLEKRLDQFKPPGGWSSAIGADALKWILERLGDLGYQNFIKLDLSVVRGLACYTGIVFGVYDNAGNMRAIAGGGRYDNLLQNLGGQPVSGVGFGMGDVVLADLLKEKGLLPEGRQGVDYYLADVLTPADVASAEDLFGLPQKELLHLAQVLRAKGRSVSYSLEVGKLKRQLAEANDQNACKVIFFGSDKAPIGSFEVKDLSSGEQKVVGESEL